MKYSSMLQILNRMVDRLGGVITAIRELIVSTTASSVIQFVRDGTDTDVSEDTGTPANSIPLPVKIMESLASAGSPSTFSTHKSPNDFAVAYTSNITVTLSGHTALTDNSQIVYIKQVKSDNTSQIFVNGSDGVTMGYATNVITIYGAGVPFVAGDVYEIGINYQDKAYDLALDVKKIIEQSPLYNRYTDPDVLVTGVDIGASDDVWVDQGSEIDVRGYKILVIWIDFTVNNSTGNQIQLLVKHTSGGTDEYILETPSSYQKTIGNSSIKIAYAFAVEGALFVQLQSKATVLGAVEGTFDIETTKEW